MKTWIALFVLCASMNAAGLHAGLGRVRITPEPPVWLSGYAARTHTATHILQDIWAKALAIEDGKGGRVVIVTTDLIGLPREISDEVAAAVEQKYHLRRDQLLLNSSHTHTGPTVWPNLRVMFDLNEADSKKTYEYGRFLVKSLVSVIGDALRDLSDARISYGSGEAAFAINRRAPRLQSLRPGEAVPAPIDHSVPVLRITTPDGKLRGVLFGYACHNTTITGEFYEVSGDYAGYAQAELEREHPGTTALFLQLCAGDQNPSPRSKIELAASHGKELATAVDAVLSGKLTPVRAPIRTALERVDLTFAPHTRQTFEAEARNADVFKARRARLMLADYDRGKPVRKLSYPVQAIRFNRDLTLVALGGEVVVDYALRIKKEFPKEKLIVAGYSNEVACYIASRRVLAEGGYEADDSMIYYGQPGPFTADVEETIIGAVHESLRQVGVAVAKP